MNVDYTCVRNAILRRIGVCNLILSPSARAGGSGLEREREQNMKTITFNLDAESGDIILGGDAQVCYTEVRTAVASGRLTDCSKDIGYVEYKGEGTVLGLPVTAVYLVDADEINEVEDEGDIDWDTALEQGRIVVKEDYENYNEIVDAIVAK